MQKKNDKQIVSNYRPVSLLPICSKIFEKLIFNEHFKLFEDNNSVSGNLFQLNKSFLSGRFQRVLLNGQT